MSGPLRYRNGEERVEQDLSFYFEIIDGGGWLDSWVEGPLLDMGAGVGRHALYFQEQFETVAIEQSDRLVAVMRDRGVDDARVADMFSLRDTFEYDRFQSAIALGTQAMLARSMQGLRAFLGDLAAITTPGATAVIDGYNPDHEATQEKCDYYHDPTRGHAYRILQMEYDGTLGEPWLYRLFTPERVEEATVGTGWTVADVNDGDEYLYQVALEKRE